MGSGKIYRSRKSLKKLKYADLLMKMKFQAFLEVNDGVSSNEDSDDGGVEKEEGEKSNSSKEIV